MTTPTYATLGERVVRDNTPSPPPALPAPEWYKASADGATVQPPRRQIRKDEPIAGGYVDQREIQLLWTMPVGAITPTPQPGGMGSRPIDALSGVDSYRIYIGSLPIPVTGAVPVPVPPTTPSGTMTHPDLEALIGGYFVPSTAQPPGPPVWTPITPNTAYAIQLQAVGLDGTLGPKSAVLYVETPSDLPPYRYGQVAPLQAPTSLAFQQGTTVPNPASGAQGPFSLEFTAVQHASSYELYASRNPRPGMSGPIGLLEGDLLVGTASQPGSVDSQKPVQVTTAPITEPGFISLKVRAVMPVQLGGNAYSPFSAPLVTVLPSASAPATPQNLRLGGAVTATTVPVAWNAVGSTPAVREYRIYNAGVFRTSVPGNTTSAPVGGYTANSPYNLTVTAVNELGESIASTALDGTTAPAARA
ncbi:hypothetical protein GCM10010302_26520 [Streptomyces polychromogenes]|uniref:Fibronectin type-III domain-containing protein n=1 Tax=Streptomyces polychromogenes TaxID=67342 RepID=A0ABP3EZH8_9ACTN